MLSSNEQYTLIFVIGIIETFYHVRARFNAMGKKQGNTSVIGLFIWDIKENINQCGVLFYFVTY